MDRGKGGLGLGRTIARQMVQMHGGSLHSNSAGLGQGATFTMRLPRDATAATPSAPTSRDILELRVNPLGGRPVGRCGGISGQNHTSGKSFTGHIIAVHAHCPRPKRRALGRLCNSAIQHGWR